MTRRALAILRVVLLSLPPALALAQRPPGVIHREQQTQRPGIEPQSEKLALYFAGQPWRRGAVQPGRTAAPPMEGLPGADAESEPTWFTSWRTNLGKALQSSTLDLSLHPLLRATAVVLALDLQPRSAPVVAGDMSWSRLVCPALAGAPRWSKPARLDVSLQVLQVSDDGHHLLGLELACVQPQPSVLLRAARLIVATDGQGKVLRVQGVLLDAPLPLLPRPTGVDATVQWPLSFVPFDRARPAHWPASPGGWLAQVQVAAFAAWYAPHGLPGLDGSALPGADDEAAPDKRVALWLNAEGAPACALFQDNVIAADAAKPRIPVDGEGLSEWPVPGESGVLLLQRVGLRARLGQGVGLSHLAFTDAGYAAWQLAPDGTLTPVALPLPRLPREGLWQCQPDGTENRLRCHFDHAGAPGASTPEDVLLLRQPGRDIVRIKQ